MDMVVLQYDFIYESLKHIQSGPGEVSFQTLLLRLQLAVGMWSKFGLFSRNFEVG